MNFYDKSNLFYKKVEEEYLSRDGGNSVFDYVGYCCFGPLVRGFLRWINSQVNNEQINCILFFSRDGYFMKQMYSLMFEEDSPRSFYFYASRRALQVASIHLNPNYVDVMKSMFIPRRITYKWLIERWGLDSILYVDELAKFGLNLGDYVDSVSILENDMVKKVYAQLKDDIITNSNNEFDAFKAYVDQFGLEGKIAVVDIGWYGNMQNSFARLLNALGNNAEVIGYYLGVVPQSEKQKENCMHGYLFQAGKNELLYETARYLCTLLELCFMAPHGSLKKYVLCDQGVELEDFEYLDTLTSEKVFSLQESAKDYISKHKNEDTDTIDPIICFGQFYKAFMRPTKELAICFGDLEITEPYTMRIAEKIQIFEMIAHPSIVREKYINSSWKMGFLKRLMRIPLPYEELVIISKKVYKKQ